MTVRVSVRSSVHKMFLGGTDTAGEEPLQLEHDCLQSFAVMLYYYNDVPHALVFS